MRHTMSSTICRWLVAATTITAGLPVSAFAQSAFGFARDTTNSDPTVLAALIALVGVAFSAVLSAGVSWITARAASKSDHVRRQNELALEISRVVASTDETVRLTAMRRFAVGIVKVTQPEDHHASGTVRFIPMNSRITVGREKDNDIVLEDDKNFMSRWHCGMIADQRRVWIDDYHSRNGTKVNGQDISESCLLKDGDKITIGPFELVYRAIRENTILSQ